MGLITDPGSALQDLVDDAKLAGTTGVHNRFKTVFDEFNGNIEAANLKTKTGGGSTVVLSDYPTFGKGFSVVQPGLITNGRLSLSSGRLKLVGDNGSDPSSTNPVFMSVPSSTYGKWITTSFTSTTYCLADDSTTADSYFTNTSATFGKTGSVAWGSDMPIMIYLALKSDGTIPCLFLSRNPVATQVPTSTLNGYKDTPPISGSNLNFFAMSATDVRSSHADAPCWPVGSIRMTFTSGNDATFTTLDSGDGLGNFSNFGKRTFTMVVAQNLSTAGSFFYVNGGTAPIYSPQTYTYRIGLNGQVEGEGYFFAGATAGVGANNLELSIPVMPDTATEAGKILGSFESTNGAGLDTHGIVTYKNTANAIFKYISTLTTATTTMSGAQQNNANKYLRVKLSYKGFFN